MLAPIPVFLSNYPNIPFRIPNVLFRLFNALFPSDYPKLPPSLQITKGSLRLHSRLENASFLLSTTYVPFGLSNVPFGLPLDYLVLLSNIPSKPPDKLF